jgi:hypothetical protein
MTWKVCCFDSERDKKKSRMDDALEGHQQHQQQQHQQQQQQQLQQHSSCNEEQSRVVCKSTHLISC